MRIQQTKLLLKLYAVISLVVCAQLHAAQKPNVIFFLVDDLGQRDLGCYGSQFYETPAIDQLAKEGMLFDNAYATCHVCSPSRASILTGKYPARTNLTEWLAGRPEREYEKLHHAEKLTSLPDEEITLAETLKQHGYATANYGKAHLRKDPKTYGFDEAITGWVKSYYHPFGGEYNKSLPANSMLSCFCFTHHTRALWCVSLVSSFSRSFNSPSVIAGPSGLGSRMNSGPS